MAKQTKQRETFDCVQWDGLKETALAFFGMNVLDHGIKDLEYFFDESNGYLYSQPDPYVTWVVEVGMWLIKQGNDILERSDDQFNDEYDIIDEYPA